MTDPAAPLLPVASRCSPPPLGLRARGWRAAPPPGSPPAGAAVGMLSAAAVVLAAAVDAAHGRRRVPRPVDCCAPTR